MLIYIAGPYGRRSDATDEQIQSNVQNAIEAGRLIIQSGHTPVVPHLYHYIHDNWLDTPDEDGWLKHCINLMLTCDSVVRLHGESIGADEEIKVARDCYIRVYYSIEAFMETQIEEVVK